MKKNIIKGKTFAFALRIIKLYRFLNKEKREYVLSKQLLRSGTAVGALIKAMFPLIVETVPAKCQAKTLLISLGTVQVNAAIQDN
ncbi:MAG: four helix bundle protein, partial [Deltaproteobacteria bacterium]|nr:four helix bundle protein [Deltaproteobacteria bacterium]